MLDYVCSYNSDYIDYSDYSHWGEEGERPKTWGFDGGGDHRDRGAVRGHRCYHCKRVLYGNSNISM